VRYYEKREQDLKNLRKDNDMWEKSTSALVEQVEGLTNANTHISKVLYEDGTWSTNVTCMEIH